MSLESVFKLSLIMNMVDNLTGPMSRVTSNVNGSVSRLDKMNQSLGGIIKTGATMQTVGSQIAGAALAPVEATFETRRALGELASLGVKDLQVVEDAARSFSDQWAGTTKADFISAAYDIKSGIASLSDEGVAEFTSLAALTGKATKSTVGEMTSLFATGYGIYKDYYADMSDLEFGEMFSAGISKSVQQFKTTGSEMAASIESLGASATNANVPLEEQLTILGMLQGTMSGSEAGKRLVTTFVNGIKSVAMAPVNAVKGIFNKIGSLFPHSDAKEGPLSTLTLSGQRTMTTFADGVSLAEDAPARAVEKSFGRVKATLEQEPPKKVSLGSAKSEEDEQGSSSGKGSGEKSVIIQKLLMQVDLKQIKDLQLLLKLLKELEDYSEAYGSDDGDAEPEPTPA